MVCSECAPRANKIYQDTHFSSTFKSINVNLHINREKKSHVILIMLEKSLSNTFLKI